ncbi:MAG: hypothetical protein WBN39_09615, partial [Flavobacteriaceae bacterium]
NWIASSFHSEAALGGASQRKPVLFWDLGFGIWDFFPELDCFLISFGSGLGRGFTKKAINLATARYWLFSLFPSSNKFGLFPKKKANNFR